MHILRRVDLDRVQEIYWRIEQYTREVTKRLNPSAVILFGSFATGDIHEASDVDICVIADFQQPFLDRIKLLMDLNAWRLPLEPVGYTAEEVVAMQGRGNAFIQEVLEKGRILYAREGGWPPRNTDA